MGAYGTREHERRPAALIGTLMVHGALLMLISWPHPPQSSSTITPALAVFDIALPPPAHPPRPELTAPPPLRPSKTVPADSGAPRPAPQSLPQTAAPPPHGPEAPMLPTLLTPAAPIFADLPVAAGTAASAGMTDLPASGSGQGGTGTGAGGGHGSGTGGIGKDGSGPGEGLKRAAWIVMPSRREMEPYWPRQAIKNRLSGRVVLACIVPRPGPPRRCVVAEEHPQGVGFGKAALQMIHLFRLKPVMREREVVDMPLTIPVIFEPPAFYGLPRDPAG